MGAFGIARAFLQIFLLLHILKKQWRAFAIAFLYYQEYKAIDITVEESHGIICL